MNFIERSQQNQEMFAAVSDSRMIFMQEVQEDTDDFLQRTSFIVREGLCNMNGYVSIESEMFPGHFWRHQNSKVKLHAKSDSFEFSSAQFNLDACWKVSNRSCPPGASMIHPIQSNPVTQLLAGPTGPITRCSDNLLMLDNRSDPNNPCCGQHCAVCWAIEPVTGVIYSKNRLCFKTNGGRTTNSFRLHPHDCCGCCTFCAPAPPGGAGDGLLLPTPRVLVHCSQGGASPGQGGVPSGQHPVGTSIQEFPYN